MKKLLACFLASICGFAIATEPPSEELQKSLTIWAFPVENSKDEASDVYVYSNQELDNAWLQIGSKQVAVKKTPSAASMKGTFTYKSPETISAEVTELHLSAYDLKTKEIVTADFAAAEPVEKAVPFKLSGHKAYKTAIHYGFEARFADSTIKDSFVIGLKTVTEPGAVFIKVGNDWTRVVANRNNTKFESIFYAPNAVKKAEGLKIEVSAKYAKGVGFEQTFVSKATEAGGFEFVLESRKDLTSKDFAKIEADEAARLVAERRKMIFGGAQYTAQQVAQARAEHMNSMGRSGAFHISWDGSAVSVLQGMIPTANGPMWEGTGWGGGGTCSNGKALIAEGRSGPYLVRFFQP